MDKAEGLPSVSAPTEEQPFMPEQDPTDNNDINIHSESSKSEQTYHNPVGLQETNENADQYESDVEADVSESSDMEESNGFQKIRREASGVSSVSVFSVGDIEMPDVKDDLEVPDIEFPDVDEPVAENIQTREANLEDIDFPENVDDNEIMNETTTNNSARNLPEDSGDIDFPEIEMEVENSCDVEGPKGHVLTHKIKTDATSVTSETTRVSQSKPEETQEDCVLRHRIDPEPPRSADSRSTKALDEDTHPRGSKERRKIALIYEALESDPVDIAALRNLAISPGGLVNRDIRQKVWPLLINVNTNNITPKPTQEEMQSLTQTYNQVVMDVNRSSSRFPPGIEDHVRMSMKDKLVDLIMRVMLKHRQLKYYQGFHDVCITFLLCMDEDLAFAMVDKLAMGIMREYLDETMERTSLLLNYIYPLVNKCNPELCQHMERNDLGTIFALSWVITWFSHVLGDIKRILRVFDFFLASHRMMPVYLSAAFVLYREPDIYEAGDEMGYIHKCLSTIPEDLPLESLLERAGDLYLQYPPTEISHDPMLIRMNRQVYDHFNRVDSRNASRRVAQQAHDGRSQMFIKATMWTVTAVVGVAAAVLYHSYMGQEWTMVDFWSPFS